MKSVPLLKIAPFSGSRVQPFEGLRRYLSTGDLQTDETSFVETTYKDKPSRADIFVKSDDILFARMKGTKKVLVINKSTEDIIVSTGFAVVRPTENCDGEFLAIYLKSDDFERQKEKYCSGAIQPAITNAGIDKLTIPFPPIEDQKRIAHLLGTVEGLIAERKKHLQQLDDLLKSVFLETFGDPIQNERGWDTSEIENFCEAVIDCPHSTPVYSDEKTGYYCVRSCDIVDGYLDLRKTLHVTEDVYMERIKRYTPQIGDIVYSREGGRLGNAARVLSSESICLGQRIMLFKVNRENFGDFLWALLESQSFKAKLQSLVGGGAAPRVNIKDLKVISVIQPPIDAQEKFSLIVRQIDRIKNLYQQSLSDLEILYGAISQKAFKGELDLTRVPFPIRGSCGKFTDEGDKQIMEPTFELPAPEDIKSLQTPEGRKLLIEQWLTVWLNRPGDSPFAPQEFMDSARERLQELMESYDHDMGKILYEELKSWIFNALEQGMLLQKYNDASNCIELSKAKS